MGRGIFSTVGILWTDAKVWRLLLTLAILLTIVWVLLPGATPGQGSASTPPPTPPLPPDPLAQQALARLNQLEKQADGLSAVKEVGRRCENLIQAADSTLKTGDRAYATSTTHNKMLASVKNCRLKLEASKRRLNDLVDTVQLAKTDQLIGLESLEGLSNIVGIFDRTRSTLSPEERDAIRYLDKGMKALSDSRKRVARYQKIADGFVFEQAGSADFVALRDSFSKLRGLDLKILKSKNEIALRLGAKAVRALDESELRWAELNSASIAAAVGSRAALRRLVRATAAITEFDRRTANQNQATTLAETSVTAKEFAMQLLVETAANHREDATPSTYKDLAELLQLVGSENSRSLTAVEKSALELAIDASAVMQRSDRRLQEVSKLARAWSEARTDSVARRIDDLYESITPLDRKRADSAQAKALHSIDAAYVVVTERELSETNKHRVPIFVEWGRNEHWARKFVDQLRADDFMVVQDTSRAALKLRLESIGQAELTESTFGSVKVYSAHTQVAVKSIWTFDGGEHYATSVAGRVTRGSDNQALRDSYSSAGKELYACFKAHVKGAMQACR